jgi:hypothetical protein
LTTESVGSIHTARNAAFPGCFLFGASQDHQTKQQETPFAFGHKGSKRE